MSLQPHIHLCQILCKSILLCVQGTPIWRFQIPTYIPSGDMLGTHRVHGQCRSHWLLTSVNQQLASYWTMDSRTRPSKARTSQGSGKVGAEAWSGAVDPWESYPWTSRLVTRYTARSDQGIAHSTMARPRGAKGWSGGKWEELLHRNWAHHEWTREREPAW